MNAPSRVKKAEPDTLRIWNALSKTDPTQTKQFSRAGGFKGTALKPMWVIKRLTEQFGPCGEGWGVNEPKFQVETMLGGETLVYCTVSCWHGSPENVLFGVGGDKVVSARRDGNPFCDDEAFKKAFTDAVNNAFKFIGVGADIHMGLFDDSKYVAEIREEFHPEEKQPHPGENFVAREVLEGPYTSGSALRGAIKAFAGTLAQQDDLGGLTALLETPDFIELEKEAMRYLPGWWDTGEGCANDFEPMTSRIHRKRKELEEIDSIANASKIFQAG